MSSTYNIRNATELPLTSLEIQVSHKLCINPKSLIISSKRIFKLQRSIHGLVQASRSWNIHFDEVIKAYGFIQTYGEACFYKKVSASSVAFLKLYVDDILLIGNDVEFLDSIKSIFE